MSQWQKNHYAVAAFTSADICYVVVFGSRYTQISFTTINKQLWPICHAVCAPSIDTLRCDIQFALASHEGS